MDEILCVENDNYETIVNFDDDAMIVSVAENNASSSLVEYRVNLSVCVVENRANLSVCVAENRENISVCVAEYRAIVADNNASVSVSFAEHDASVSVAALECENMIARTKTISNENVYVNGDAVIIQFGFLLGVFLSLQVKSPSSNHLFDPRRPPCFHPLPQLHLLPLLLHIFPNVWSNKSPSYTFFRIHI